MLFFSTDTNNKDTKMFGLEYFLIFNAILYPLCFYLICQTYLDFNNSCYSIFTNIYLIIPMSDSIYQVSTDFFDRISLFFYIL